MTGLGYRVVVAGPGILRRAVIERGYAFAPAGQDWTRGGRLAVDLARIWRASGNEHFNDALVRAVRDADIGLTHDVARVIAESGAGLVVRDCSAAFTGCLPVPSVAVDNGVSWMFPAPQRDHEPLLTPAPPDLLGLSPGTARRVVEYRHVDPTADPLPTWIADLAPDRPLVYVSLGSLLTRAPGMAAVARDCYRRVVAALACLPVVGVIAAGDRCYRAIAAYAAPHPHIHVVPWVPGPTLIRKASLVLFHGGFGTLRECLVHGARMLLMPLTTDQPHNAARLGKIGLAPYVSYDAPPDEIRHAIARALSDASQGAEVRRWQRRALSAPSLADVLPRLLPI